MKGDMTTIICDTTRGIWIWRVIRHPSYVIWLIHAWQHDWFIHNMAYSYVIWITDTWRLWTSHGTPMTPFSSHMSQIKYEWVVSHLNEPCHIWMRHVTSSLNESCYVNGALLHLRDRPPSAVGRLRFVGSIKLHVSFAEYCLFYRALLQKRPIILSILLTKATPYHILRTWVKSHMNGSRHVRMSKVTRHEWVGHHCNPRLHEEASFVDILGFLMDLHGSSQDTTRALLDCEKEATGVCKEEASVADI